MAAIIRVERTVHHFLPATGGWKSSYETSFYLSSRTLEAKTAAVAIREHWGIENTSHYSRDVSFREDASRIRKNPGVFARLGSFAYDISSSPIKPTRSHRTASPPPSEDSNQCCR